MVRMIDIERDALAVWDSCGRRVPGGQVPEAALVHALAKAPYFAERTRVRATMLGLVDAGLVVDEFGDGSIYAITDKGCLPQ